MRIPTGVGGEIQLTDALDELLKHDGLNSLETDAGIHDGGNKQGFLSLIWRWVCEIQRFERRSVTSLKIVLCRTR